MHFGARKETEEEKREKIGETGERKTRSGGRRRPGNGESKRGARLTRGRE